MAKNKPAKIADLLPRAALLRLLAVLSLLLAPHLQRLPIWAAVLVVGIVVWRTAAAYRGWPMLPGWMRVLLTFGAFAGVYASFGRVSGQTAGVALITVMAALKLTELRARRDTMVMVFLMYFMLITHFLFSQELWTAAYLLVMTALITGVLIDANHPGSALPLRDSLRISGGMVLRALPLMLLIFVLFPRIPGPIWGLPADAGAARSGLSDSMAPGEISSLINSEAVAFRVRFDGAVPPARERYWRGPSFARFDGRKWDSGMRPPEAEDPIAELSGPAYGYEVVLEPNRTSWLFALDLPSRVGLPSDARLNADYQLVLSQGELRDRRLYRLSSHPQYRLQTQLPDRLRTQMLQLPKNSNPRAQALAQQWRDQGLNDAAIVKTALQRYRTGDYYYTLQPPSLGRNSVDEFLFDTRRGFCEHYASSFAVLMRAAGIPARIVTGYQGGEPNAIGDYWIVRQSDAHAWTEVWLAGRGWLRVDPTAAVAPERVERGIGSALSDTELPTFLDPTQRQGFRFNLEARWDWANAQWNYWVLGYGPELQADFLHRFGLGDWQDMILALTITITAALTGLGWLLLRQARVDQPADAALRAWRRLQQKLARIGLVQGDDEGPRDYVSRVVAARPELAPTLTPALALYLQLRYLDGADSGRQRALERAVGVFTASRQMRKRARNKDRSDISRQEDR